MSIAVRRRWGGAIVFLAAALTAAGASAEVRVTEAGDGRLTIEAHDATVRQVLDALRAKRPLQLRTSDALTRSVTGTYTGSLSRVLARILDGYNHVVHSTAAGLELEVVGSGNAVHARATVANSVTLAPSHPGVSSNVDADEEAAAARPRATVVNAPPAVPPQTAAITGGVPHPGTPRVSSNLDLDEETSR
ncbi:MAG TPA: hypothetical protein VKX28_02820 [Xanthobacteraceae bacterium]|nr:hypothetical protein [Xanthobacteraceae bacterium]